MASSQPRPLPKFGEWDEKNPSSADSFTVIFAKASDEKRANSTGAGSAAAARAGAGAPPKKNNKTAPPPPPPAPAPKHEMEPTPSRFCCF